MKTCIAIIGITTLEALALSRGIDGVLLGAAIGAIAGLGGFTLGKSLSGRRERQP